jgi:hypothetical protein
VGAQVHGRVRVALLIQYDMHTPYSIFIYGLPGSTTFLVSHKRHNFQKKVTEPKVCVLIFSTTFSKTSLILGIIQ